MSTVSVVVHRRHRPAGGPRRQPAPGVPDRQSRPGWTSRTSCPRCSSGADLAVVRLLGGRRAWEDGLARADGVRGADRAARRRGRAGRRADGRVVRAGRGGRRGAALPGRGRPRQPRASWRRFLSDTVLLTGEGFAAPRRCRSTACTARTPHEPGRPTVGVALLPGARARRATPASSTRCARRSRRAAPTRCRCTAVRCAAPTTGLYELLRRRRRARRHRARRRRHRRRRGVGGRRRRGLGRRRRSPTSTCPCCRALCLTSSRRAVAGVGRRAVPDGRGDAGGDPGVRRPADHACRSPSRRTGRATAYPCTRADPERAARVAGIAVRHARLKHKPNADKRLALVLHRLPDQALPGRQRGRPRHARLGGRACCDALRDAGYATRRLPGRRRRADPPR